MIKISFSSSFKRAFRKNIQKQPALQAKFWNKVEIFKKNPFDECLRTHKLSGKLKELWSFSIEYDVRVIFYFVEQDKAIFIDIGSHDDVY
jgi:proteic killer suppression protein